MNPNPNENQKVNKSGSSRLHETNTQSLEKSLTTLSWLVTVNVDELRRKHEREDKVDNFGNKKPSHSYADLIRMAITSTPQERMTLSEIYEFVENKFPYYKSVGGGWKNSIRHNLSLNVVFQKLPRPRDEPGKGSYWIINPNPPKPENFRNHSNRKRTSESKAEVQSSKRPSIEDLNSVNYQDIYESLFKPHSNMTGQTSLPSVGSFSTNQNQMSPSSTSVTSNESGSNQSVRAFPTQQLPHPLQRPNQYNQACSSTQQIQQNSQSESKPDTHKQLCRLSSDPLQWSIDHLRLSEASMRNNPEFQHILSQLKSAESQNWEIDEKSRTSLAFSLSQFMFKQNESSNAESDDDVNGFEDINGGEIDYVKLAQL